MIKQEFFSLISYNRISNFVSQSIKLYGTLNVTGLKGIVEHLIENGANINGVNKLNNSALSLAIESGILNLFLQW